MTNAQIIEKLKSGMLFRILGVKKWYQVFPAHDAGEFLLFFSLPGKVEIYSHGVVRFGENALGYTGWSGDKVETGSIQYVKIVFVR